MNYIEEKFHEINYCIDNFNVESKMKLKEFLLIKETDTYAKQLLPAYCSQAFLFLGIEGIVILKNLIKEAPGLMYPTVIMKVLYATSQKKYIDFNFNFNFNYMVDEKLFRYPEITDKMADFSLNIIGEIVAESLNDAQLFSYVIHFIWSQEHLNFLSESHSFSKFVFNIFRESSIKVNNNIIQQFHKMILNPNVCEEEFQVYLKENPALIDPLAKEVIPKQRLGVEYITDFVIRKLNDEYVLVEIEKPSTPIFTKMNDFTAQFTHALGQILDFQEWVESNIAYAEKLMPGIGSPLGLLVLGRKNELSEFQKKKLRRFNINNQGKVKVITFDDLIDNAHRLYNNMLK
ncbi:Shedu anti-phage system protein SduA domain-containing protein [Bacillus cereus]|uniref:Shedu anti-phage system protein SduA domain-containing protein n=2 Tax=Bacillus TaxID=1386 RepID=UPI0015CF2953|nr:Shedu anti-phage system protein SduA domain-containing protein [Bacillus cereus]